MRNTDKLIFAEISVGIEIRQTTEKNTTELQATGKIYIYMPQVFVFIVF